MLGSLCAETIKPKVLCESCEEYFIITVFQYVACYVIKVCIFHHADFSWETFLYTFVW